MGGVCVLWECRGLLHLVARARVSALAMMREEGDTNAGHTVWGIRGATVRRTQSFPGDMHRSRDAFTFCVHSWVVVALSHQYPGCDGYMLWQ
jgi:hypothetical protein